MAPKVEYVDLDEDLAIMLKEANDFYQPGVKDTNRRVSHIKVKAYAEAMLRGEWRPNTDAIAVGMDGRLKNGQKRILAYLQACETARLAGKAMPPVKILFVQDLPDDSMAVIDIGEKRTAANYLQIKHGIRYATEIASVARLIWVHDNVPYAFGAWSAKQVTNIQLENVVNAGGVKLEDAVLRGKSLSRVIGTTAAGAGFYLCDREMPAYRGLHLDFYSCLQEGIGLYPGNPVLALRNFYTNGGAKADRVQGLALYIRAFSAYIAGAKMNVMSFKSAIEKFPKVGELTRRTADSLRADGPGYWITNELERLKAENNADS